MTGRVGSGVVFEPIALSAESTVVAEFVPEPAGQATAEDVGADRPGRERPAWRTRAVVQPREHGELFSEGLLGVVGQARRQRRQYPDYRPQCRADTGSRRQSLYY